MITACESEITRYDRYDFYKLQKCTFCSVTYNILKDIHMTVLRVFKEKSELALTLKS